MADDILLANYDEFCDVLYLSVGEPNRGDRSQEGPWGVIWRKTAEGVCRGVTIRNFQKSWLDRRQELVEMLASNLHMHKKAVRERVPELA
jgi:hypothetical protein